MGKTKVKDTVTPEIKRIKRELKRLSSMTIKVGVQGDEDSQLLMIAGVHEYGATITAKKAQNLTIPIHKDAKGKSPRDFPGLFFIESDGNLFGCVLKGRRKDKSKTDNLKFLFLLLRSVTIPERSFIRGTFENKRSTLDKVCRQAYDMVVYEQKSADEVAEFIGITAVGITKKYFSQIQPPKNSKSLDAEDGKNKPLISSGRLRNAITFKVEVSK